MLPQGITDLIDHYLDGEADATAVEQLRSWLDSDDANIDLFAHQVYLHQQLRETMVAERAAACLENVPEAPATGAPIDFGDEGSSWSGFLTSLPLSLFAIVLAALITGVVAFQLGRSNGAASREAVASNSGSKAGARMRTTATLISVTNCRWDPTRSTANTQDGVIRPGESLNLLEGVAEINTSLPGRGVRRFQVEGPSAMMLSSEATPNLQYGKLVAEVQCDGDRFALDTPLGRAIVPREGSFGLIVTTNEVELHVFAGELNFEPVWPMNIAEPGDEFKVGAGGSLRMSTGVDGKLAVKRAPADEKRFVTYLSMSASQLEISPKYIGEIRAAQPIGYWRFEGDDNGLVRNEMADRLHCRIHGDGIRWRDYHGNRVAEFGSKFDLGDFGCLMSDDSLGNSIQTDYALEAWIKPSHFHHGAFFSLIEEPRPFPAPASVGLLFELSGLVAFEEQWSQHPGRIRFLHRNPPGSMHGVSSFSQNCYTLRQWQHLVGVKDGEQLRLYLNGKQVASGVDSTDLAGDMRILIGQLYPHDPGRTFVMRPFVGELDEIALYDRALSDVEIGRHYQLARPAAKPPVVNTPPES